MRGEGPRKCKEASTQTGRIADEASTQTGVPCNIMDLDALDDWGEGGQVGTLKITVDSGAAESVMPDRDSPGIQWVEAPANRLYRAANGTTIKDKGAKKVSYAGPDGKARAMTFRIADVTKPLASVARMCDKGNWVVFDPEGSYIEHKRTGTRTHLKRHLGVFVLEVPLNGEGNAGSSPNFIRSYRLGSKAYMPRRMKSGALPSLTSPFSGTSSTKTPMCLLRCVRVPVFLCSM